MSDTATADPGQASDEYPPEILLSAPYAPPSRRNRTDPDQLRATYSVPYPSKVAIITSSSQLRAWIKSLPKDETEPGMRVADGYTLVLLFEARTVRKVSFQNCSAFFQIDGVSKEVRTAIRTHAKRKPGAQPLFERITFEDCSFNRCMLGSSKWHGCEFRSCRFSNVDFQHSILRLCVFDGCRFTDVTWSRVELHATLLDPATVLPPLRKYRDSWGHSFAAHREVTKPEDVQLGLEELDRAEEHLARELLRSAKARCHVDYAASAIRGLRRSSASQAKSRFLRAVLKARNGLTGSGTTYKNPFAIALFGYLLAFIALSWNWIAPVGRQEGPPTLLGALELCLTFGATRYYPTCTLGAALMGLSEVLGLIAFGLVLQVFARRSDGES